MTDIKATPGPWKYEEGTCNWDDEIKTSPGSIMTEDGEWYIAKIEYLPEQEANARLIAAAPDLVAALIEAQAALNGAPNTVGLHCQIDAALSKAGVQS